MKIRKQIVWLVLLVAAVCCSACTAEGGGQNAIIQERRGSGVEKETVTEVQEDSIQTESEPELYIFIGMDTEQKTLTLQKAGRSKEVVYPYDTGTKFLDKYGNSTAGTSFVAGDVTVLTAMGDEKPITSLQISDAVWVQDGITNYAVDSEKNALTIGKTKYRYDKDLLVFSDGEKVKLQQLGKEDEIRVIGQDKKILSVSITKGNGTLAFSNTKIFEGSFICIGEKIFLEVTPNMQVEVPEGKYLVTVANNGYGGSREVTVERNKTTAVNLDELKGEGPKICKLTFQVGVKDAVLELDGKTVDYSKPIEVQYGIHKVAVSADGYDTITEKLVVNSKEAEIEIALTSASETEETDEEKKDSKQDSKDTANTDSAKTEAGSAASTTTPSTTTPNTSTANTNTGNTGTQENQQTTDYLTTLYNLLNSINKKSEEITLDANGNKITSE